MRYLFAFTFVSLIMSCNYQQVDAEYVRSTMWSYQSGFKIGKGDIVLFKEKQQKLFELKEDTIYYEGKPRAIIKNVDKNNFIMRIRSIDGMETGTYRNVEESLR